MLYKHYLSSSACMVSLTTYVAPLGGRGSLDLLRSGTEKKGEGGLQSTVT